MQWKLGKLEGLFGRLVSVIRTRMQVVLMPLINPLWLHPRYGLTQIYMETLCFLSKVLEKILYMQMMNFVDLNNLLSRVQSGFRLCHKRNTALIDVSENVREVLEDDDVHCLGLLDHSKAFDTIDLYMFSPKLKFFTRFSNTIARLRDSDLAGTICSSTIYIWTTFFSFYANDLAGYLLNCKLTCNFA